MEIEFLVRKGRFNWANPAQVTTNVHISLKGDDFKYYINIDFEPERYKEFHEIFHNCYEIDTIIEAIEECCDRVLSYIYNPEKPNAKKIKELIHTDEFIQSLASMLLKRIESEKARIIKKIEALKSMEEELKSLKEEV